MLSAANDRHQRAISDLQDDKQVLEAKVKEMQDRVSQLELQYKILIKYQSYAPITIWQIFKCWYPSLSYLSQLSLSKREKSCGLLAQLIHLIDGKQEALSIKSATFSSTPCYINIHFLLIISPYFFTLQFTEYRASKGENEKQTMQLQEDLEEMKMWKTKVFL